jgi:rhodanese-related sulfurtransferase
MKHTVLTLFCFLVLSGCKHSGQLPITEFDQAGLEGYTLIDVRTPEEFVAGHLENAININWYDEDFAEQVAQLSKENTMYVYCQKGGRSAKASALLDSLGFRTIDLTGGYGALPPDPAN